MGGSRSSDEEITISLKNKKPSNPNDNSRTTVFLNPQRKRLEQLHQRRKVKEEENNKIQKELEKPHRNKVRDSHGANRLLIKPSAEVVEGDSKEEYSAEETEEEILRGITNENLRNLMVEKIRLDKALKQVAESDKKQQSLQETSNKWFDKYDDIVNGIEEQMDIYDASREIVLQKILEDVKPLSARWADNQKLLKSIKEYKDHSMFSFTNQIALENVFHYGVTFLRNILFAVAYCRDALFAEKRNEKISINLSNIPKTK